MSSGAGRKEMLMENVFSCCAGLDVHKESGSHWVSYGNDWCSKPVLIDAGTEPIDVRFVMDRKEANCQIYEIDGLRK